MHKKLFTTALSAIMVIAMAVPVFAATPPSGSKVWIYNSINSSPNLNAAYETGTPRLNTNVTMWSDTGSYSQRWKLITVNSQANTYYVANYGAQTFGLNIYRDGTNNCDIYPLASNSTADKTVKVVSETGGKYGIVNPAHVLCLTPTGFSNGSNVNWQTPTGQGNQLWFIHIN